MLTLQSPDDSFLSLVPASKSDAVRDELTKDTYDAAEPTEDEADTKSDHWADLLVTAESDDDDDIIEIKKLKAAPSKECYECHLCFYRPATIQLLMKHMLRKHTFIFIDSHYYVCEFCKSTFAEERLLEKHLIYHLPKKKCINGSWKPSFGKRWSKTQKAILEDAFGRQKYVEKEIAKKLNVHVDKVQTWFKNRKKHVR